MRPLLALAFAALAACASDAPVSLAEQVHRAPLGDLSAPQTWLGEHRNAGDERRAEAFSMLCEMYARMSRYREAADTCGQMIALQGDEATKSSREAQSFWQTLSGTPPIGVQGQVDVPLTYGWTGMGEIPVTTNGVTAGWGVDTGAEFSVVSETDAARFGVRRLGDAVEIHGSTPGTAAGRLGVIDSMRVGAATITNVPVFILPDAGLMGPNNQRVPPIFGAPIMYAFGRIEFADHGQRLRLMRADRTPLPGRMAWNDAGLAIDIALPDGDIETHLDTGANISELHESTRDMLTRADRRALTVQSTTTMGVSGAVQTQVWTAPALDIGMAGVSCRLEGVQFGEETGGGVHGRVGIDLMKACADVVLDVSTMTFSARAQ